MVTIAPPEKAAANATAKELRTPIATGKGESGLGAMSRYFGGLGNENPSRHLLGYRARRSRSFASGFWSLADQDYYDARDEIERNDLTISGTRELIVSNVQRRPMLFEVRDGDDERQAEWRDWIEEKLKPLLGAVVSCAVGNAISHGFAMQEICWEVDGETGLLAPRRIDHRHPGLFCFNENGEPGLVDLRGYSAADARLAPRWKFIYSLLPDKYANPYGKSLVGLCGPYFWLKKVSLKSGAEFLERYGMPIALLKLNEIDQAKFDELKAYAQRALEALKSSSGLVLPSTMDVTFEQRSAGRERPPHFAMFDLMDMQIVVFMLGAALGTREAEFGSRAQADVHKEATDIRTRPLAKLAEDAINRDLVDAMLEINFGRQARGAVRLVIDTEESEELDDSIKALDAALNRYGLPVKMEEIYERLGLTIPGEDDEVKEATTTQPIYLYDLLAGDISINEHRASKGLPPIEGGEAPVDASKLQGGPGGPGGGAFKDGDGRPPDDPDDPNGGGDGSGLPPPDAPESFADDGSPLHAALHDVRERVAALAASAIYPDLMKAASEALAKNPKAPALSGFEPGEEARAALEASALLGLVGASAYMGPVLKQLAEERPGDFSESLRPTGFAVARFDSSLDSIAGSLDERFRAGLEWMLGRKVVSRTEAERLARKAVKAGRLGAKGAAKTIRDGYLALKDSIKKTVGEKLRAAVASAVGSGSTLADAVAALDKRIRGGDVPGGEAYVQTVFRTETANAYSHQQREFESQPGVSDALWGWEISTSLDDATRPSHRALDGKRIRKGSRAAEILGEPPWSYNCRCALVPIIATSRAERAALKESEGILALVRQVEKFAEGGGEGA